MYCSYCHYINYPQFISGSNEGIRTSNYELIHPSSSVPYLHTCDLPIHILHVFGGLE